MPDKTVGYVDATFGGRKLRFEIPRDQIAGLEAVVNGAAYQLFTKFAGGFWTIRDLEAVLTFAAPAEIDTQADVMAKKLTARIAREHGGSSGIHPNAVVTAVLREKAPATYAPLALRILEAALFGIKPSDAVFSDKADEVA